MSSTADLLPNGEGTEDEKYAEDENRCSFKIQSSDQVLETTKQERLKGAKVKHVKQESSLDAITNEEREQLFDRKEDKKVKKAFRSLLTYEMEKGPFLPENPFRGYAKFDGNGQAFNIPTQTFKVFLTMLPKPERDRPLQVCVSGLAKVSELIGFVCWHYLTQYPNSNFTFHENVDCYSLYIADDKGEVDLNFCRLDPMKTVMKIDLPNLAMSEVSDKNVSENKCEEVENQAGDISIEIKDNTKSKRIEIDFRGVEALSYRSFYVYMLNKIIGKTEVVFGISGDIIEIDPVAQNHTSFTATFWKQKPISYDIDFIVSFEMLEVKSPNRAIFRMVYFTKDPKLKALLENLQFKNHDFETDQHTAEEIVKKGNRILQLTFGTNRKEYFAYKQRELEKRNSFSIWPRWLSQT